MAKQEGDAHLGEPVGDHADDHEGVADLLEDYADIILNIQNNRSGGCYNKFDKKKEVEKNKK